MGNTIDQFDFDIFRGIPPESGKLPHPPVVRLNLKHWDNGGENPPTVSPNLMTEQEIDSHIALLKADLDAAGRRAKSALRRATERHWSLVRS
jgi:hypothetical protein